MYGFFMKKFSQLLVERIQEYFKEKYDLNLSEETAQEYLNSYASLYIVFAKVGQKGRTVPETDLSVRGGAPLDGNVEDSE